VEKRIYQTQHIEEQQSDEYNDQQSHKGQKDRQQGFAEGIVVDLHDASQYDNRPISDTRNQNDEIKRPLVVGDDLADDRR
jgi:hypothetical protein